MNNINNFIVSAPLSNLENTIVRSEIKLDGKYSIFFPSYFSIFLNSLEHLQPNIDKILLLQNQCVIWRIHL